MGIFSKIFKDAHQRYFEKNQSIVAKINTLEPKFELFSDEDLKIFSKELQERARQGENIDNLLPSGFALVREAAKRTMKQRHYDEQLLAGIALHEGKVIEMKTGEGKTLAATLPAYLNALMGKGVHIVTVNDYLARRDMVWMGQIYDLLGVSVACINHQSAFLYNPEYKRAGEEKDMIRDSQGSFKVVEDFLEPCSRKQAYEANITYGTNNEFGFDYLKDNMAPSLGAQVQAGFQYAILDEIDSILIDEARTPLIISRPESKPSSLYKKFAELVLHLKFGEHYEIDEEKRLVTLTQEGIDRVEQLLGVKDIYSEKGLDQIHHIEQALRAQAINPVDNNPLFARDRDYVVNAGEVIIVDEFTGRLMPGRRWSGGLHQAIEAKENVEIQPESRTLAKITFQNLFRFYNKLAGMTGTAVTSAEELDKVYGLDVVCIPTHRPMIRKPLTDQIYKSKDAKLKAIARDIKERHEKGQPLLIGTRSIEKNEYLAKLLDKKGIVSRVLNAKEHEKEAQIIAQAGKLGAVTVATNMAGRGVDIVLGGNPQDKEEVEKIKSLGGLHVIGTERHEARRIDDQLRGRSGRQGDPGSSQFFLSLEDELLRVFGGERMKSIMDKLDLPEEEPIHAAILSRAVESAQTKIEGMHMDMRSRVLDYDNVLNKHRDAVYKERQAILLSSPEKFRLKILEIGKEKGLDEPRLVYIEKRMGENFYKGLKTLFLQIIDFYWARHLEDMDWLRNSVGLRAYANLDPLVEYKSEGYQIFQEMKREIEERIVNAILGSTNTAGGGQVTRRVGQSILDKS